MDGEIVAAAEEERFGRDKHASNRMPLEAARYCLAEAGIPALPGAPVVLNTSLNRRGEPIACMPAAALDIFTGSNLRYLVMEDFLVGKPASDA